MQTDVKTFTFAQTRVLVQEELGASATATADLDLGCYVWPCAIALATFLSQQPQLVASKAVVELGAGTALPGLLAAKLGAASVRLTDKCIADLVPAARSIALNQLDPARIHTATLAWGWPISRDWTCDVVLAADCFYEPDDFEDAVATIARLLALNPTCKAYVAYQLRSVQHTLQPYLARWRLQATQLATATPELENVYLIRISSATAGA
ncbi:hypothetical protein SPRG_10208 [Saprolegnia parasitica CBS 223.65]|uniref:Methyltransferase domain-containing protein n=1 Tax=Saprolegnia parasitica (strain CBS 223.65) TaxID=695850 RepID=A0A067C6D4_SAPPC|nr:hypothetical protein SPRG_10208 [Saprolegnia parasitica CBS 223.65]KDO24675.1 hypothetical protein SPRG_10208 [Saprolegnia parasitica CBS 223.65]|eukprot:XP_012204556.1 hypothetical protein SPRG_10208 [Saprolegnia parasitica CBS 223.65]